MLESNAGHPLPPDSYDRTKSALEAALAAATPSQRAAVQLALNRLQSLPRLDKPTAPPRIVVGSLLNDAQVLLVDNPNQEERRISDQLDQFIPIAGMELNQALLAEVSAAIAKVSPRFQHDWRAYVLKNHPYLDRIMPDSALSSSRVEPGR